MWLQQTILIWLIRKLQATREEGEIYSNKIQIKNVKIISDLQNEAIKGINQIELETGNIKTVLKNNQVNELLQGKEITIESSEGLKSNTKIEYEIKFYDKNGKELKVSNNKGEERTELHIYRLPLPPTL